MKKSLVVLAGLSAFAGAASAQSNVTVYGIVDAGITREFGTALKGTTGSTTKLTSGAQSGSRLGFKGTEDLGGGLSANFVLENGFKTDTGVLGQQGQLFGRQAYVGLSSKSLGSVNVGRQYAPTFNLLDSIDPFGSGLAGAETNLMGTPVRVDNTIKYSTPTISGFNADVLYGLGEVAGNNSAGRNIGFSAGYANGPLNAGVAYHTANDPVTSNKTKRAVFGGTYNFAVVKAALAYETEKDDSGVINQRDLLLGVTVPLTGADNVFASYIRKDDRNALNQDANQLALGYTHALSTRTNIYTAVSRISNKNGGSYTVGNATEAGTTNKAINVGIRHKF